MKYALTARDEQRGLASCPSAQANVTGLHQTIMIPNGCRLWRVADQWSWTFPWNIPPLTKNDENFLPTNWEMMLNGLGAISSSGTIWANCKSLFGWLFHIVPLHSPFSPGKQRPNLTDNPVIRKEWAQSQSEWGQRSKLPGGFAFEALANWRCIGKSKSIKIWANGPTNTNQGGCLLVIWLLADQNLKTIFLFGLWAKWGSCGLKPLHPNLSNWCLAKRMAKVACYDVSHLKSKWHPMGPLNWPPFGGARLSLVTKTTQLLQMVNNFLGFPVCPGPLVPEVWFSGVFSCKVPSLQIASGALEHFQPKQLEIARPPKETWRCRCLIG